jgi:uncharacterized protein YllA (UPF0747 family)
MATEDHDFEEINYFNFKGRKFRWNAESAGPVGRLSTAGLDDFFEVYAKELGTGKNADAIKKIFQDAYLKHSNLADATRFLANTFFGEYGLVILDTDDQDLKRSFIPFIKEELLQQTSHKKVLETTEKLKNYSVQVNPREINLFYLEDNLRERITMELNSNGAKIYKVNNTKIAFSESEIFSLLENHPDIQVKDMEEKFVISTKVELRKRLSDDQINNFKEIWTNALAYRRTKKSHIANKIKRLKKEKI